MIIQPLLIPHDDAKNIRSMYLQGYGFDFDSEGIHLKSNAKVSTLSYFNAFALSKWKKYTKLKNLSLKIAAKGSFTLKVLGASVNGKKLSTFPIISKKIENPKKKDVTIAIPIDELSYTSIFFDITTRNQKAIIYDAHYATKINAKDTNEVFMAVGICTFKREEFLVPNLHKLENAILDESSPANGRLDVYVSDNGSSKELAELSFKTDRISIFQNPNYGGASGFARTMIESLKSKKPYTHFLFLDDDVEINISAIERNIYFLTLLKEEYKSSIIGGAMFSIDEQWLQFELASEIRGAGNDVFNRRDVDLRNPFEVVANELEYPANYNAWCYCCTPYSYITESNLPNPIFFHMDDVEYSLRNNVHVITLNGINVWHLYRKAVHNAKNDYYDVRNRLITLSEIDPASAMRMADLYLDIYTQMALRYHYAQAFNALNAIIDFCKGFDYFLSLDTAKKHAELESDPVSWADIDEGAHIDQLTIAAPFKKYPGYKNDVVKKTFAAKKGKIKVVLKNNTIADALEATTNILVDIKSGKYIRYERDLVKLSRFLLLNREAHKRIRKDLPRAVSEFHNRLPEVQNLDFWSRYLGLAKDKDARKKVILVSSDNSRTSGAFRSMTTLATILRDEFNMNVLVVLPWPKGTGASYLRENGVKFTSIESSDWIVKMDAPDFDLAKKKNQIERMNPEAIEQFVQLFEKEKPDVVHINTSYSYVAAVAAKKTGTKLCWHIREFLEEDQMKTYIDKAKALELMANFPLIGISNAITAKYRSLLPEANITRIYNGIDSTTFFKPDHSIMDKQSIRVLCVGVLFEGKGQHLLLEAVASLPKAIRNKFKIVFAGVLGSKEFMDKLGAIIKEGGLEKNVAFLGPVNNVDEECARSDVLCVCAKAEAFGRTTVEAMMSGCLVIGANSGGTSELIEGGSTGLLFETGDPADLASKLKCCVEEREMCKQIAKAGQEMAMERFTALANAKSIHDFYVKTLHMGEK